MKTNHIRRVLLVLLSTLLTAPIILSTVGVNADGNGITSDKPATVRGFDSSLDSQKTAHQVSPGSIYGTHLHLGGSFNGLTYCLPTWGATDSCCTLALYTWEGNYDDTVSAEPISEKRFENIRDCQNYTLPCDDFPAGDYFFAIQEVTGKVGTWLYPAKISGGHIYDDALESEGDLELTVKFIQTPETPFIATESLFDVDGEHTAPEEYVIPEDSLLYTHEVMPDTWVFTDGLGRKALTNADVGDPREDRTLALFYWTWHGDLTIG